MVTFTDEKIPGVHLALVIVRRHTARTGFENAYRFVGRDFDICSTGASDEGWKFLM